MPQLPFRTGPHWKVPKHTINVHGQNNEDRISAFNTANDGSNDNISLSVKKTKNSHDLTSEKSKLLISSTEEDQKKTIGSLAIEVIESPQENILNLKTLMEYGLSIYTLALSNENALSCYKLILATMLTVFADIIPAYVIREPSEAEQLIKVSREVAQQRQYESHLLKYYHKYITLLVNGSDLIFRSENTQHLRKLSMISVKCLLELLKAALHFNFYEEILIGLSRYLIASSSGETDIVTQLISYAIGDIFESDSVGFKTCRILKKLSIAAQNKSYRVHPLFLESLLKIKDNNLQAIQRTTSNTAKQSLTERKKQTPHLSKKAKKNLKEQIKWRKELDENEAVANLEKTNKVHQESMIYLFKIYFGVLKKCPQDSFRLSLISGTCRGLIKFSYLIDSVYFADLIKCLRNLTNDISSSRNLETRWNLCHCLLAIFIISSHQKSLFFDLVYYYKVFYSFLADIFANTIPQWTLHPANKQPDIKKNSKNTKIRDIFTEYVSIQSSKEGLFCLTDIQMNLLQKCLTEFFCRQANLPNSRVAAFVQRLIWICLGKISSETIIMILSSLIAMGKAYPAVCKSLLAANYDDLGCGALVDNTFNPEINDPDNCSALEYSPLSLLNFLAKSHRDEKVRTSIKTLLGMF